VADPSPTPAAVAVTRAVPAELEELTELFVAYLRFYGEAHPRAAARAYLAGHLERGSSTLLLARATDGTAVGFAQLYDSYESLSLGTRVILYDLFVAHDARRSGVGRALVLAAAEHARAIGAGSVSLDTATDNHGAQALYRSLGFVQDTEFLTFHLEVERAPGATA
jgi:ribosomal protein S18 acetylase RimI-like enzyme